ncbi:MAG: hypothetical protein IPG71_04870 [bacterium]|nr:hypothetical protein [bacterium]
MRSEQFITLGHGAGGTAMRTLIRDRIAARLQNGTRGQLMDGAILDWNAKNVVFTTDSFVVQPIEFAGGDIGKLSVCGTVNDLLVMGATPLYLSLGLILEEGCRWQPWNALLDLSQTPRRASA